MFERKYDRKMAKHDWKFSSFLKGQRAVWSEATRPNALFLSTAIQLNSKQLTPVFEWFQKRLVVIAEPTKLNAFLTLSLLEEHDGKEKLLSFMQEADFGITGLDIKREPFAIRGFDLTRYSTHNRTKARPSHSELGQGYALSCFGP